MEHQKQIQVRQRSGTVLNPNLDDSSLQNLIEAQYLHKEKGNHFSQSVLIRRAVRVYTSYLRRLTDWNQEVIQSKRAAKGVQ